MTATLDRSMTKKRANAPRKPKAVDPVTQYTQGVRDGTIIACRAESLPAH